MSKLWTPTWHRPWSLEINGERGLWHKRCVGYIKETYMRPWCHTLYVCYANNGIEREDAFWNKKNLRHIHDFHIKHPFPPANEKGKIYVELFSVNALRVFGCQHKFLKLLFRDALLIFNVGIFCLLNIQLCSLFWLSS